MDARVWVRSLLVLTVTTIGVGCGKTTDCRQATQSCSEGFACEQAKGGAWECVKQARATAQPTTPAAAPATKGMVQAAKALQAEGAASGGQPKAAKPAPQAPPEPAQTAGPRVEYVAVLGPLDHVSSKGVELTSAAAVLRQDRARVHRFNQLEPGDEKDALLGDPKERAAFETTLRRSNLDPAVRDAIVKRRPKVRVRLFADHAEVTVIELGAEDKECIIAHGRVGGIPWHVGADHAALSAALSKDKWRIQLEAGGSFTIRTDSGAEVARGGTTDDPAIKIVSYHCRTGAGTGLLSGLQDVGRDPAFRQASCLCGSGGSQADSVTLIAPVGKAPGAPSNDEASQGQYVVEAACRSKVSCEESEDDPMVYCRGDWRRLPCVVKSIRIGPPT